MSACEKCWRDAGGNSILYKTLMASRNCTPRQQAGPNAKVCPTCGKKTLHQHTGECMNPVCPPRSTGPTAALERLLADAGATLVGERSE